MLKQTERNRRQAICAGLIASTIVTADCADEEGVALVNSDDNPSDADLSHMPSEVPGIEGAITAATKIAYELVPLITPLPPAAPIAPEFIPCAVAMDALAMDALAIDALAIDAVSQAGRFVELEADFDDSPKLTVASPRQRTRSARLSMTAKLAETARIKEATQPTQIAIAPELAEQKVRLPVRSLLQDDYMAFGVNGR